MVFWGDESDSPSLAEVLMRVKKFLREKCEWLQMQVHGSPLKLVVGSIIIAFVFFAFVFAAYLFLIYPFEEFTVERFGQFADFTSGMWNSVFGAITLLGLVVTIVFQVRQNGDIANQLRTAQIDRSKDALRIAFFGIFDLLNKVVDRIEIDRETKEAAFCKWHDKFIFSCHKQLFDDIKSGKIIPGDLKWYVDSCVEANSSRYFVQQPPQIGSFRQLLDEFDDLGILEQNNRNSIKEKLLDECWNTYSGRRKDEVIRTACAESFADCKFSLGPFFKTFMRLIEVGAKDAEGSFIAIIKSQLTVYQMVAIQANSIIGACNAEHDEMIQGFGLTNDAILVGVTYSRYLHFMYTERHYIAKR